MDKQVLAQVLGKLRFSASLPENVLDHLADSATLSGYPAGTRIFREGDATDRLLIISIGRVALDMHVPGRGDVRILSLGPGDMVAWSTLLGGGRMTASATALEDTQAVTISIRDILSACEANHTLGYYFMRQVAKTLADRLVATRLQLLDLFSETLPDIPFEPQRR